MSKPSSAELKYMARVAELPCVCCDRNCEALHHPRELRLGCGMGWKAPQDTVIPLWKFHHDEFHRLGKKPWEAKYGEQVAHVESVRSILKMTSYERSIFGR
jgi:hypothetical protein